jgi:hypothetical protein
MHGFGLGLAVTAVVVLAASGGAYAAGQITGGQIKDGTITGADVKNRSLSAADFRGSLPGSPGPPGAPGPAGAVGPVGPVGPAGPNVTARLTRVQSTVAGPVPAGRIRRGRRRDVRSRRARRVGRLRGRGQRR